MRIAHLKQQAAGYLKNDSSFRRLVLIHSAISAGVSLLLMAVGWIASRLAPDGSLSHMDTLVLMDTVQATLRILCIAAVPLWDAGLIFCALRLIRGRSNSVVSLTEGFFRWLPFLISGLVMMFIYFLATMACSTVTGILLSFLPMPASVYQEALAFMENPTFPLEGGMLVFTVAYCIVYLVTLSALLIPMLYLHRLVSYRIMDDEPCGGLQAVLESRMTMRGHRRKLFGLDMSFWWFYFLELLTVGLSMGDLLLAELGIAIPYLSAEAAGWVFPLLSLVAQLLLYWLAKPRISVSYALFYQSINATAEAPEPKPRRMPWKY